MFPRIVANRRRALSLASQGLLVVLSTMAYACGPSQLRPAPLNPGLVECSPAMECLPDPDVIDSALSERMRFGWTLAAESFLIPPPVPPGDRNAADLQRWSSEVLAAWLERKSHTVDAARRELDAAAEEQHRQRIMGGAIVGLMYEDMARILRAIPPPSELDGEPEIAEIYRSVLRSQARPFLEHSRAAYRACAQNALHRENMRHWSRFCTRRQDLLPPPEGQPQLGSGESVVEVIADN